jgi:hypothetical protein
LIAIVACFVFFAENYSHSVLGLLQHYLPTTDIQPRLGCLILHGQPQGKRVASRSQIREQTQTAKWKECPMLTKRDLLRSAALAAVTGTAAKSIPALAQIGVNPAEARAIVKDAYIYGFPMVDSYRIQHAYFVDTKNPEYKAPWNHLVNTPRVYTPTDTAIQTPNSDTPYSWLGLDLRAEPFVLTVPVIEKDRYFCIQFIDAYTFNFSYVGSRATGNGGGSFLVAGPNWKGEKPAGVKEVIRSETDFIWAAYRTQLFNPEDLDNVREFRPVTRLSRYRRFLASPRPLRLR